MTISTQRELHFISVVAALLACCQITVADEVAWRSAPAAAQRESQLSKRPLLIYVGAEFCGYCRKLERTTWSNDTVARNVGRAFVPLHIDGQQQPELARQLGVRGFPAVIVLSPAGELIARFDGYRGPQETTTFLTQNAELPGSRSVEFSPRRLPRAAD